ncbi:MAG: hypothetical protein NVSMB9_20560 [Isosphaeraceae bacterium]
MYHAAAARQGVVLVAEEIQTRFRRQFREDEQAELPRKLASDETIENRRWRRIVANVLPELPDPERGFQELWDHFARSDSWRVFPDVGPTIEALQRAGLPVRIASNFDGRLRRIVEGKPELAHLAHSLLISSEVGFRKPASRFYEATCLSLRLSAERILFVGDHLENDVLGPERAGLRGVWLDRSQQGRSERSVIHDLWELMAILGL